MSVFEIRNSQNYKTKIMAEIQTKWKPKFTKLDSVWSWEMTDNDAEKRITKLGHAEFEDNEVVMIGF